MLSLFQISAVALAFFVALIIASEGFAFAVSRVMEAAFERVEHTMALRARSRAERLKSRRREERRRAARARSEQFVHGAAYSHS
jgi:hypothetical protein